MSFEVTRILFVVPLSFEKDLRQISPNCRLRFFSSISMVGDFVAHLRSHRISECDMKNRMQLDNEATEMH